MINSFTNENAFLSNFFVDEDGFCVEKHFQALKTKNIEEYINILLAETPGKAKRLGRKCTLRPDWEDIKVEVMRDLLDVKFQNPLLRDKLIATHPHELVEGNNWGDTFWGVCRGSGENQLGKLLMELRDKLYWEYMTDGE